jgi:MoCo/4Fe-4S cofactor protein with predicted Tat translocation signal
MSDSEHKKCKYWTTLDEWRGDPAVEKLRHEEFYDKPQRTFDAAEVARQTGKRPGAFEEAAGFAELTVLNNGGSQSDLSRRDFLKLSSAAVAFATAGCALRPTEKIIPYVKAPEEIVPGVANYYASTINDAAGTGVLVRTREGRPIKIEGNPDHPLSQGKLNAAGQAEIFNLYDPNRLQNPVKINRGDTNSAATISFNTADEEIGKALASVKGKVVLLTGTIHGPARTKLVRDFVRSFPNAQHVMYDAWNYDATRAAAKACYGWESMPRYHFDRTEYFLFFECDPLGTGYSSLEWSVDFAKTRDAKNGRFSKVIAFESYLSLTGSNADERMRIWPGDGKYIAWAIANELVKQGHFPPMPPKKDGKKGDLMDPAPLRKALPSYTTEFAESKLGLTSGTISRLTRELWEHRGKGLVMGGEDYTLQVAVNLINAICGNDGKTIDGTVSPSRQARGSNHDMRILLDDMNAGRIDVLIVHDTNPAFTLPPRTQFADAIKKVKAVVSLADRIDETAQYADYVLPTLHWLESWDDAEPQVGMFSLTQPAIYPLYENRAWQDSLLNFARAAGAPRLGKFDGDWLTYLKETWKSRVYLMPVKITPSGEDDEQDEPSPAQTEEDKSKGKHKKAKATPAVQYVPRFAGSFEQLWTSALRDGVVVFNKDRESYTRAVYPNRIPVFEIELPTDRMNFEMVVYPSPLLGDGRHNNNAWLLECPDPVTRLVWTNVASMSPQTAAKIGVTDGDVVELKVVEYRIELPVHIQPGNTDGVISVQAGWGRTHAGKIGNGVGANPSLLLGDFDSEQTTGPCRNITSVIVTRTGRREKLASAQGHDYLEARPIISEATYEEYQANPKAGHEREHKLISLWPEHPYTGNRWGMTIDLSSCIGCNACILACEVENNIPVVGREEFQRGRKMHWIRVDRYYSGEPDAPDITYQPMLCQHCENAPCETVCPVIATVHNEEGLNQQIYNRCVGTRYCSNNCPYKVRRFNFHEYAFAAYDQHPLQLVLNPDVTVREKGVMEKCTFCVHRIRDGKGKAKQLGRPVQDGDVVTACQQTCPTGAITFGNMNDAESRVAQNLKDERSYHALEELNVKPSIAYWTKLRNRPVSNGSEGHHA